MRQSFGLILPRNVCPFAEKEHSFTGLLVSHREAPNRPL